MPLSPACKVTVIDVVSVVPSVVPLTVPTEVPSTRWYCLRHPRSGHRVDGRNCWRHSGWEEVVRGRLLSSLTHFRKPRLTMGLVPRLDVVGVLLLHSIST